MDLLTAKFFLFLGVVTLGQAVLNARWRLLWLIAASLFFYATSSVGFLALLLGLSILNYWAALNLSQPGNGRRRNWIFGLTLFLDLGALIIFKYLSRFTGHLLAQIGWSSEADGVVKVLTPLGISYFTFQMIGCVSDAYRQTWKLDGGWRRFLLFSFFFPQISSGPIPRARHLLPQLTLGGSPTWEDRWCGLRLIAYGLFKKYVAANHLGEYVTQVFDAGDGHRFALVPTFLACLFNVLNLYADFSGYVDIAIGSARLLGIRLEPNFDRPFLSTSVTEFWRRWHMTLSFWVRDYVFMPTLLLLTRIRDLGKYGVALVLIFTFAIVGIWHNATWPFLLFGLSQGVAMSVELLTKAWRTKRLKPVPVRIIKVWGWFYAMSFFALSEIFFRASTLSRGWEILSDLFQRRLISDAAELFAYVGPFNFILDFAALGAWFGVSWAMRRESKVPTPWFVFICALLIMYLGDLGSARFIYAAF